MQKLRRCQEDRWDFTVEDAPFFPMSVHKGGTSYGFCPAKATWDYQTVQKYRILIITSDTGAMLYPGSIMDQPDWFIDLLGWFLPLYEQIKWNSKMRGLFGDSKNTTKQMKSGVKQVKGRQKSTIRRR